MPARSRIFTRATPALGDALAAHSLLGTHVYLPPPGELLVVRVPDGCEEESLLAWLRGLGAPIAWYHLLERGDELYYDRAIIIDGQCEPLRIHSTGSDPILRDVWRALGTDDALAYFAPDDDAGFDWGACRVAPAHAISDDEITKRLDEGNRITEIREGSDRRYLGHVGIHGHWAGFSQGGLSGELSEDSRFYVRSLSRGGVRYACIVFRQFTVSKYQALPEDVVAGWVPRDQEWEALCWVDEMNAEVARHVPRARHESESEAAR